MKIEGPNSTSKSGAAKKAKKSGATGGPAFADSLRGGGERADGVDRAAGAPGGGVGAVSSIDLLLAVQGVGDATDDQPKRQRASDWGATLLDRLDDIRLALLSGRLSADRLQALRDALAREREQAQDPNLAAVLKDIELRARVELAKLSQG